MCILKVQCSARIARGWMRISDSLASDPQPEFDQIILVSLRYTEIAQIQGLRSPEIQRWRVRGGQESIYVDGLDHQK
jgi:hypothetical protein